MKEVGFIINNEYLPYIKQFEPYSDRLQNMNLTLINGYDPTEYKQKDEKEAF